MDAMGRPCLKCQPSSRTGENPPYGMIGGTVETSASFEARYAPLSYPTAGINRREVEDERASREGSSDPLGPEPCVVTARDTTKQRQGYRRGGY